MSSHEPKIAISTHLDHSGIPDHDELKRLASELLASESIVDDDQTLDVSTPPSATTVPPAKSDPTAKSVPSAKTIPMAKTVPMAPSTKMDASANIPADAESDLLSSGESNVDEDADAVDDGRTRFSDLKLPEEICRALLSSGYEFPTAIQAATIPAMLEGRDVLGQAQTGTGKTAAFALPLLSRIDVNNPATQVLVLAPTRELAIQVSESFQRYAQHMRGLRVAPIYGGQAYATQIHALQRGVHVVVGTPGRVMDHMRENRLRVDTLQCLVLDEADEMLRMGFVDDVRWVLEQTPSNRQVALFSATMPQAIREIADKHLKNPHVIAIDSQLRSAETIRQRFVLVEHRSKFEALLRILEAEDHEGMIIFVKTRLATVELADNLTKMGHTSVALNGDIAQAQRERTVEQLKQGVFNILVATDVAARGLDVQRVTHVINYDLPIDSEAYVHRIGRTGRAGRSGEAIVFIAPRQRGFLREIDRAAGEMIQPMAIPTAKEINEMRISRFKSRIVSMCSENERPSSQFSMFENLIEQCIAETELPATKLASALAMILQAGKPFLVDEPDKRSRRRDVFTDEPPRVESTARRDTRDSRGSRDDRPHREDRGARQPASGSYSQDRSGPSHSRGENEPAGEMERFRVEVGRAHGVRPGNLVGAIANEAGLEASHIGQIAIFDEFSTVDLPSGMPREVFKVLGRAWVVGRQLRISKLSDHPSVRGGDRKRRSKQLN
jgi:ATP-dependent RNA helicase DeaD